MARIAFGVEYDGSALVGWQAQRQGRSVQGCLEQAFSTVADEPLAVVCAGRTDAGVHATAQVIHVETNASRSIRGWLLGVNSNLPIDITLRWGRRVADEFHARFSARSRTYQYLILNRATRSALWRERCCWERCPLDLELMREGAQHLVGQHDFSSFRAAPCQASTPVRTLGRIDLSQDEDMISIVLTANAFLQHMVRNIAGTLIRVGRGDAEPAWVANTLAKCDRRAAGPTAPASGLYLIGVEYEEEHGLSRRLRPTGLFRNGIESARLAGPSDGVQI